MGKNKGAWTWVVLAGFWLCACTAYQSNVQYNRLQNPVLGEVRHQSGQFIKTHETIGHLVLREPLPLQVVDLPFNKQSYSQYVKYLKTSRRANTVPFNDSLPIAPRYVRLQLADRVELIKLLNEESNKALCDYIVQDEDYGLVESIDFTTTDEGLAAFFNASHVFLDQDEFGKPFMMLLKNKKQHEIYFEDIQIFDSEILSFCWAEDRYQNKYITNLTPVGDRCPKGSAKKAIKLEKERERIKL